MTGKLPFFSIVVPTYQRPALLQACLSSILNQSYENFEVVIGNNDPSTPLCASALRITDSRVRVINRPTNIGAVDNIIELLWEAKGHYVTWLADDDLYLSRDFLKTLLEGIEQHAYPKVLFTSYQNKTEPDLSELRSGGEWQSLAPHEFLHEYLQSRIEVIGNYGMWDTEFLKKLGGMKKLGTGFSPYTDTLLSLEAAAADRIFFLDRPLIFFRAHEYSRSWTSEDLSAYASAQMDLIFHFVSRIRNLEPYPSRDRDLYCLLKKWCIGFFGAVATRSKSPQLAVWPGYYWGMLGVSRHLPFLLRIKFLARLSLEAPRVAWTRLKKSAGAFRK